MTIFVITHGPEIPLVPDGYSSIGVGPGDLKTQFRDNSGTHIAELNPHFCELTAIYWVWKNVDWLKLDYIGFCHYRRYFSGQNALGPLLKQPIKRSEIISILRDSRVILPSAIWLPGGLRSQFGEYHPEKDFDLALKILSRGKTPEQSARLKFLVTEKPFAHMFNMFVMQAYDFDRYCKWLFPILFELHHQIDYSNRSPYQQRSIGFISERLINLWVWTELESPTSKLPILRMDQSGFSNLRGYHRQLRLLRRYPKPSQ